MNSDHLYTLHQLLGFVNRKNNFIIFHFDCVTGNREGERRGCRFYSKNGLIYDADINAAINIAKLSKLPVSYGNILDGQALVNVPNVCKPVVKATALQAPMALA